MKVAAGTLAATLVVAASAREPGFAGWHDPNIVAVEGGWKTVPDEAWGNPHAPYDDRWQRNSSTIVVLIAALRESRLPATIKSAFDNAAHPERVRVGVVQQNAEGDPDCLATVCAERGKPLVETGDADEPFSNPNGCEEFDRVRVLRMKDTEAKGPVFARGLQPQLVHDEDFCMQIDAHTIFKKDWDMDMLREWGLTRNEFAVLSTYPTNYKDLYKNSNRHWEMPHICGVRLFSNGAISNLQAGAAANLERPLLAPVWAAGLSFSRCHAERKVPNDVNLRQIFSGEEYSRGARLWTHGYDFYSITRPTIGVYYGGDKGGKGHWQHNSAEQRASQERLKTLLHFPGSDQSPEAVAALGKFGLGTRRSLAQYAAFSGIDTTTLKAEAKKCIVNYVPWDDAGLREEIEAEERALRAKHSGSDSVGGSDEDDPVPPAAPAAGAAGVSARSHLTDTLPSGENLPAVDPALRGVEPVAAFVDPTAAQPLLAPALGLAALATGIACLRSYQRSKWAKGRRLE